MDKTMQTNLCQAIRACGLPKRVSHELLNTYVKWIDSSGLEWTNGRIKGIKQWYESFLAGNPAPVPYMKHNKSNLPTGVFGYLFRMKNQAKVLAALSINTLFKVEGKELLASQKKKFLEGIRGNPHEPTQLVTTTEDMVNLGQYHRKILQEKADEEYNQGRAFHWHAPQPKTYPLGGLTPPTLEDMTGMSFPVSDGKTLHPRTAPYTDNEVGLLYEVWDSPGTKPVMSFKHFLCVQHEADHQASLRQAFLESWRAIPEPVVWLMDYYDLFELLPPNYWDFLGSSPSKSAKGRPIGRLGIIQEPALKLRSVYNPNRVAQHFTKPFMRFIRSNARDLPGNCCEDQDKGVRWIQDKLKAGVELVCFDLTSATDLLDMESSLELVRTWCLESISPNDEESMQRYDLYEEYFRQLCRGEWVTPEKSGLPPRVKLQQGQNMGLDPSFDILQTTNCCLGIIASQQVGEDPSDSFVAIGDDFCCTAAIADPYLRLVTSMGGKINTEKTLRSNRCAEFAGRVITRERVMRKSIKFRNPGDMDFMSYVSDLGPQAVSILRPRQRRIWEQFRFVPGIAFDGPWNPNSEGEPLDKRVAWSLQTHLFDAAEDPDPTLRDREQQELAMVLEAEGRESSPIDEILKDLPIGLEPGIQPDLISFRANTTGDPRAKEGMTTLQRLERESRRSDYTRYSSFNYVPFSGVRPEEEMSSTKDSQESSLGPADSVGQVDSETANVAETESPCETRPESGTCKGPNKSEEGVYTPLPLGPRPRGGHDRSGLDLQSSCRDDSRQGPEY